MTNDPYAELQLWLGAAVMIAVPGYFALQAWFAHAWTGAWRTAALTPLLIIAPCLLWSIYALMRGSNLWPIPVLLSSPFCFAYLVMLSVTRWLVRRLRRI